MHGVLSRHGYRVSLAATASELADLLSSSAYDAVILNLTMPPARGTQHVSGVRAMMDDEARLVIYSVDRSHGIEAVIRQAGADQFFQVPIRFNALLQYLEASNCSEAEPEALQVT
ncbi:hypothetical protein GCM10027430_18090 [Lysobacter tyrosinilyticus]